MNLGVSLSYFMLFLPHIYKMKMTHDLSAKYMKFLEKEKVLGECNIAICLKIDESGVYVVG